MKFTYSISNFILLQFIFSWIVFFIENKKLKRNLVILFLMIFTIYLGMRDSFIGTDTKNYINAYLKGDGGYFSEKGFKYLGFFIYKMSMSEKIYIFTISVINTLLYYIGFSFYFENKDDFYITLWIFLFNVTSLFGYVNILRQSLAGGFLLISLGLFIRKKMKLSLVIFIIGFLFHKSILFFILLYFKKTYILCSKISYFYKKILILLLILFSNIVPLFLLWHYKFLSYAGLTTNKSFYFKFILLLIFYFYIKIKDKNLNCIIFYGICLIAILIKFELVTSRLIYYINIFIPIVITYYLKINGKNKKRLTLFIIGGYHVLILFYPSVKVMFNF